MQRKTIEKVFETVVTAVIGIALLLGFFWVFGQAVLQESFKITPPTQEELREDPSLSVYLQNGDDGE